MSSRLTFTISDNDTKNASVSGGKKMAIPDICVLLP
jgi:hypothetical protein